MFFGLFQKGNNRMLRTKHSARRSSSRRFWTGTVFTLLLLLAVIVGGWFYALQRANYQPEWYESVQSRAAAPAAADPAAIIIVPAGIIDTRDSTFIAVPTPAAAARHEPGRAGVADGARKQRNGQSPADAASIWQRVQRDLEQKGRARVAAFELVPLFVEMLKVQGRPEWAALVKAGKSQIHQDQIVSETILDLRQVPVRQLRSKAAEVWNMVQQMIPKDRLADVYLKVDARPRVQRGYLRLDEESALSVGKIALPITELEKRFNVPLQVEMDRVMFSKIELGNNQLILIR